MYCSTPINEWLFPPFLLCFYIAIALYFSSKIDFNSPTRAQDFRPSELANRPTNKIVSNLTRNYKNRTIIARQTRYEKANYSGKYSLLLYFKIVEYLQNLNRRQICQLSRKLKIKTYLKAPLDIPLRERIKTSERLRAEIKKVFRTSPQTVLAAISKTHH